MVCRALFVALALFAGCAVAQEDAAPPSVAHLVVHKSVAEKQLVIGQNMTIKIEVFNAGSSPATAIELTDPGWESDHFEVVGPSTSAKFSSIAPGAKETLQFVVVPKVTGQFSAGPSLITYQATDSSEQTSGVSNALPRIPILSTTDKHMVMALQIGTYVSLGFCKTASDWTRGALITAVLGVLVGGNWIALRGKDAIAQNRRRKAIADLTKEE